MYSGLTPSASETCRTTGPASDRRCRHHRQCHWLEPRHVYVRLLPLHDVRYCRCGSCYDQGCEEQEAAIGLVLSAAICAFICGVTEPFEFGFMFLCFPLYVVYAALYGIFTIITYYVGFRAGFCFSAGATDLVFSSFLPAANNTLMIIAGYRSIRCILSGILLCDHQVQPQDPGLRMKKPTSQRLTRMPSWQITTSPQLQLQSSKVWAARKM